MIKVAVAVAVQVLLQTEEMHPQPQEEPEVRQEEETALMALYNPMGPVIWERMAPTEVPLVAGEVELLLITKHHVPVQMPNPALVEMAPEVKFE
jgi:hypothetical protein